MDFTLIVTYGSFAVLLVGGIIAILDKISKYKKEQAEQRIASDKRIMAKIDTAINPLVTSLEGKQVSIDDLWKDVEKLEDHLNTLQVQVARNSGVIDIQTPLINEVRAQIELLRAKIEAVSVGVLK